MAQKPFRYAVLEAIAKEMRADPNMSYFYEYQSPVATLPTGEILNLWKEFGPVRTSGPGWALDEAWYVGCATGYGATGEKCVIELPTMTTIFGIEYIYNQVSNIRMMTGGQASMPIVIWIGGAARGRGSAQQHTQVGWEAMYANIPGLKVVIPSNAYDAAGLMTAAIRDPDPIVYCQYSEAASGQQPDVPDETYEVPIGEAIVRQEGSALTLVAWAPATVEVTKAMPELKDVEIIDLRSIKPYDTTGLVAASVKKTGKLLVVEHGYWTNGFSAHVVADAAQKVPGLKAGRITFPDAGGPAAAEMIMWMKPDAPKIVEAAKKAMAW